MADRRNHLEQYAVGPADFDPRTMDPATEERWWRARAELERQRAWQEMAMRVDPLSIIGGRFGFRGMPRPNFPRGPWSPPEPRPTTQAPVSGQGMYEALLGRPPGGGPGSGSPWRSPLFWAGQATLPPWMFSKAYEGIGRLQGHDPPPSAWDELQEGLRFLGDRMRHRREGGPDERGARGYVDSNRYRDSLETADQWSRGVPPDYQTMVDDTFRPYPPISR